MTKPKNSITIKSISFITLFVGLGVKIKLVINPIYGSMDKACPYDSKKKSYVIGQTTGS